MKTETISHQSTASVLDRLLDPLVRSFTPAAARAVVDFRIDPSVQAHIAGLAEKCNEGRLTPAERQEYEDYVRAGDLITILQSKARRYARVGETRKK